MAKPVILTGLRANNDLHIGNYFGALLPLIDMAKSKSDEYEINLFMPDLHSFTTPINHSQLQAAIWNSLRTFVAAGLPLDNPSVHLYRQSYIPAHSELTWIFDCFTGYGELKRMTEFKDKSARLGEEHIGAGQFNYPPLMAADILLYGAEYVPVGDDQRQHIEYTRNIAERLNSKFGALFVVPKSVAEQHKFFGKDQGLRIKDLVDPSKKMSKSDDSSRGIIFLSDNPDEAAKKIMSATTDSVGAVHYDLENQPGVSNLLQLHALLSSETLEAVIAHHEGQTSYGELKKEVAEQVKEFLQGFQERLAQVDDELLQRKLESDEFLMNEVANATLARVQRAVGLRPKKTRGSHRAGAARKPEHINFEHFAKVDIRVGKVIAAERLEASDKLIKLQVDLGDEQRQILTGMQEFYAPEDFVGKQVPILVNLAPRTMMGEVSQGMLLALESENGPVFLLPEKELKNGSPLE